MEQLALFATDQAGRRCPRRRAVARKAPPLPIWWPQLGLFDQPAPPPPADDGPDDFFDEDPFVTTPIHHMVVSASLTPAPQTSGIRSVFDLAARVLACPARARKERPQPHQAPRHGRTLRDGDCTRHVAMRHDETEEWQERERQRRARQRVPRPSSKAKTRSRKLLDLIGPGEDDG